MNLWNFLGNWLALQLVMSCSIVLFHHDLDVHGAHALVPVVFDVVRPRAALDVDQHARCNRKDPFKILLKRWRHTKIHIKILRLTLRPLQVNSDQWTEVPILVGVREVVPREASIRQILEGPDVLPVCRVLTLAGYPHHVQLKQREIRALWCFFLYEISKFISCHAVVNSQKI